MVTLSATEQQFFTCDLASARGQLRTARNRAPAGRARSAR
jgi:hypothetical protein